MVRTQHSRCQGPEFDPWGTKSPQAMRYSQKKQKERKEIRKKENKKERQEWDKNHLLISPVYLSIINWASTMWQAHCHCYSPTGKLLWCFPTIIATQLCSNNHHPQKFPGEEFFSYAKLHCIIPLKCPWGRALPLLLVIISSPRCRGEKKKEIPRSALMLRNR